MASSNRPTTYLVLWACVLGACSGSEKRFPLREPLWRDTDLEARSVPCERRPTEKDPQHIAAADYAHEPAVAVHDRQPLDGPVVHELRSLSHAIPWPNRYRRNARQLSGSCAASPLALLPPAMRLEHVLLSKVDPVFLENQVRFRDDTYNSPLAVNHRQGADAMLLDELDHLLEASRLVDRHDLSRHEVGHVRLHLRPPITEFNQVWRVRSP